MKIMYESVVKFARQKDMDIDEVVGLIATKLEWINQFSDWPDCALELVLPVNEEPRQ